MTSIKLDKLIYIIYNYIIYSQYIKLCFFSIDSNKIHFFGNYFGLTKLQRRIVRPIADVPFKVAEVPQCYGERRVLCKVGQHKNRDSGRTTSICAFCARNACKAHHVIICSECYGRYITPLEQGSALKTTNPVGEPTRVEEEIPKIPRKRKSNSKFDIYFLPQNA